MISKNEFFLGQRGVIVFYTLFLWMGSDLLAQCFVPPQAFVTTGSSSSSTLSGHGHFFLVKKNRHDESFLFMMSPSEHISLLATATTEDTTTSIATTTIPSTATSDGTMMNIANSIFLSLGEDVDVDAMVNANAALEGVRIFFTVMGGLVLAFVGLTYATVTFIIPKASEQLERDTKRLRPGLWEEFEAKLGEGETMATRPDLLQELGNIMQPVIMEDFERSAANAKDTTATTSTTSAVSKRNLKNDDNDDGGNQWKD